MAGSHDMDGKNQVVDLPDPKRAPLTPEERLQRQWELITVVIHFVSIYACLHKFFIPFTLKFTSLSGTPYAAIQPSLILPISLAIAITRARQNNPVISFLSGFAVLFGVYEIYLTAVGEVTGWFAFSRLLSSIPIAITCGFLMSQSGFKPRFMAAWGGAGTLLLVALAFEMHRIPERVIEKQKVLPTESRQMPSAENPECGAQELHVPKTLSYPIRSTIVIEECGLSPSIATVGGERLVIENKSKVPVNLHLLIEKDGRNITGWNLLVREGTTATTPAFHIPNESIGLLYSDSSPSSGIVAVQAAEPMHEWILKRKPIAIKKVE